VAILLPTNANPAPYASGIEGILFIVGAIALAFFLLGMFFIVEILRLFGKFGAMAGVIVLVGATIAVLSSIKPSELNDQAKNYAQYARLVDAESKKCVFASGEQGLPQAVAATDIFVRIDPMLIKHDYYFGRLSKQADRSNVHVVGTKFPEPRPPNAAFVDFRLMIEPVPQAEGRFFNSTEVHITSSSGATLGRRIDIERNRRWCLGDRPEVLIERFIKQQTGISIGLAIDDGSIAPHRSPVGSVGPIETGEFFVRTRSGSEPKLDAFISFLDAHGCKLFADRPLPGNIAKCASGTTNENGVVLDKSAVVTEVNDGWLLVTMVFLGSGFLDTVDVVKRNTFGIIIGSWRIRFPQIRRQSTSLGSVYLEDTTLRMDLLFSPRLAYVENASGSRDMRTWFREKATLRATLGAP